MSLTLYYHPLATFCHKVLIALYETDTAFDRRVIDLGDERDRAELSTVSPFGKFPALRDHDRQRNLAESTVIIEYLDHFFAGAQPLIPGDWEEAQQARLWDRLFDNYVQLPMQQIVSDRMRGTHGDLSKERATLETAYRLADRQLADRTWIAGRSFGLADCAAAPALFYASTVHPFGNGLPRLAAYFDRLVERPTVARVLMEAKPYFQYFPFADAIPTRFR